MLLEGGYEGAVVVVVDDADTSNVALLAAAASFLDFLVFTSPHWLA